ncbi:hypothetical protein [Streptomyces anthocyanicus]|nr:hypothetical protein [Streptomyces anthocyanicus]WSB65511.1 hypothetical protein OIE72_36875 [Streptomyces anthocyanicus]
MTPELVRVNFKARDDSALGRFWAEAWVVLTDPGDNEFCVLGRG